MADCELIAGCIFFNDKMADIPSTAELMKNRYCKGSNDECARHMVFRKLGKPQVPADLFPHDVKRAETILSGK